MTDQSKNDGNSSSGEAMLESTDDDGSQKKNGSSNPNTAEATETLLRSASGTVAIPSSVPSMVLNGSWTMWFDNPKLAPQGSDWKENLKQLATFRTVPDFWRVYNNILPPSMISISSNYSIFREGIEPTWEHPRNVNGGKFVLTVNKAKPSTSQTSNTQPAPQQQQQQQPQSQHMVSKLDEFWLFTVLAVLGETMDDTGDLVCGAVVSVRKSQDRIALWLKMGDPEDQETCIRIGQRWKKALDIEKTILRYQTHKDAAATGRSFRNEIHFEV